jgi:hypothetical protein
VTAFDRLIRFVSLLVMLPLLHHQIDDIITVCSEHLNLSDPFLAVPKLLLSWLFPWENQWTMARIFGAP